ncbi:hypothetical protein JN11_02045 [Mucilaginibacter frigoritolerans]|uniref:Outer membrane protein with beta-barrel domain n=2 Tax=Mucilaginibacter frigoritolerans TaxID=652788 RepID=A0A562U4M7_9SPHI|nr:hypothetical protein JN11_02045 [Mucilaginibacter frigoritolerans]
MIFNAPKKYHMNKVLLLIAFIFICGTLKAQNDEQSLNLGFNAGGVNTYFTNSKASFGYSVKVNYYPSDFFDVSLETQFGTLSAGTPNGFPFSLNNVNFINKYQAVIVKANLHFGTLIDEDAFLDPMRHFYAATGIGYLHNRINDIYPDASTYIRYKTPVIPVEFGYNINIKSYYNDPLLKINLSYSLNYVTGLGLDGFNNVQVPASVHFYSFYSIGIEYTMAVFGRHSVPLLRF